MAIITTEEAKVFLQITGTTKDDLIDALIPEIQGNIIEYCNTDFVDPDTLAFVWPSGIKLVASMMIGYVMAEMSGGGNGIGMQSESQGGYSYTRATSNSQTSGEFPPTILAKLDKWKKARVHFGSLTQQHFDRRGLSPDSLAKNEVINGIDGVVNEN